MEATLQELERELKPQQVRFVRELLANGGNQQEAAIRAGYSERSAATTANRLLKNEKVLAYKRACARQIYSQLGLTTEQIGLHIYEIFERCMAAKPHLVWDSDAHDWVPDGTWTFDAKGATRAMELLGKMSGAFRERVEVSGSVEMTQPMSMAEKQKRLSELLGMQNGADRP